FNNTTHAVISFLCPARDKEPAATRPSQIYSLFILKLHNRGAGPLSITTHPFFYLYMVPFLLEIQTHYNRCLWVCQTIPWSFPCIFFIFTQTFESAIIGFTDRIFSVIFWNSSVNFITGTGLNFNHWRYLCLVQHLEHFFVSPPGERPTPKASAS